MRNSSHCEGNYQLLLVLFWYIAFSLIWCSSAYGTDAIRFDHVGEKEGFAKEKINCIVQDSSGYLWFGMELGLYKYDGYSFTIYKHDPDDPQSLSNSFITQLCAGPDGSVWIGTENGEINRFDSQTGRITRYQLKWASRSGAGSQPIENICIDSGGTVWICMNGNGLANFDPRRDAFVPFEPVTDENIRFRTSTVMQVLDEGSGKLWLTVLGVGPVLLDRQQGTLERKALQGNTQDSLRQSEGRLLHDSNGGLWLATWGRGLFRYDREQDLAVAVTALSAAELGTQATFINCIIEDTRGYFWIGTAGAGLIKYDPETDEASRFFHDSTDPYSLNSNAVTAIFEDESGSIWVGTHSGLNKYNRYKYKFNDTQHAIGDSNNSTAGTVLAIVEDRENSLWIGSAGFGVVRYDLTTGQKRTLRYSSPNERLANMVDALYEDSRGDLYVGTANSGLLHLNKRTEEFERLTIPQHVSDVIEDRDGVLWVATYVNGLGMYDRDEGVFEQWHFQLDSEDRATSFDATVLYEDRNKNLWIGTDGYGLIKLFSDRKQYLHFIRKPGDGTSLSDNRVLSLCEDLEGNIWIGTRYGLNKHNPDDNTFASYYENTTLPDNVICGILCDDSGVLWLSTLKGLARFIPGTGQCRGFDMDDGLVELRFSPGASYKNKAGKFFFGNAAGFNAIDPRDLENNPNVPHVVITSFKKLGYEHSFARPVDLVDEIVLNHNENFFTFEFSALDFTDPEKNSFAYQLVGVDKEWIYGGEHSARYTKVPPGTYEFRVKAANNDGLWNEDGKTVSIRIVPPFWMRWDFRFAAVVAAIASVFTLYRMRIRQIKRQQDALQAEIDERIKVEKRLRAHQKRLRSLASEMTLTEERERRRISTTLHDRVGHALFLTKMELSALLKKSNLGNGSEASEKIIRRVNDSIKATRELTVEISPPSLYKFGLEAAAESLLERFGAEHGISTELRTPNQRIEVSDEVSIMLYQSLRELLLNTLKHAGASTVRVSISAHDEWIRVKVQDNGAGFDILKIVRTKNDDMKGFGLFSIQERMEMLGGELKISSEQDSGTEMIMIAPRRQKSGEIKR